LPYASVSEHVSRRDEQHPTAFLPLTAEPLEGEDVAAKCLQSRPELRQVGVAK